MDLKGIIALIVFVAIVGIIVYRNWPSAKSRANRKTTDTKDKAKPMTE